MPDLPTGTVTFLFTDVEGSGPAEPARPGWAFRLVAASDAVAETMNWHPSWTAVFDRERWLERARALDSSAEAEAAAAGRAMTLEQAIAYALGDEG